VLGLAFGVFASNACHGEKPHPSRPMFATVDLPAGVKRLGSIQDPRITESSGVVASRQYPGVFWTHNDGAKSYTLFAISREGKALGNFHLANVVVHDWEDIAIDDEKHLYVADIGNNDARRFLIAVHEIDEPDPKKPGTPLVVRRSWELRFPNAPFDCETLFVWKGFGYVVSKVFNDARAEIYRFPLTDQKGTPFTLELVAHLKIDSPVTGGDISTDGKLLGLVSKSGAWVYRIKGDVAKTEKVKPVHTKFKHEHIEGCCFVPDGLLATAETGEIFLFTDPAFHPAK